MTTYPSLDEAFDAVWKTAGEWNEDYQNMTFEEFHEFFEYAFCNRLTAAIESNKVNKNFVYFRLPMFATLCQKMLESAYFLDSVPQEFRESTEDIAKSYFDLLVSVCDEERSRIMKEGWEKSKDYCDRFGYKSGVIFEVLAPHRVFS